MKNLHLEAIVHEPKSRFAYAYSKDELHIRIQTKKDSINDIKLIYGDPFEWNKKETDYVWAGHTKPMTLLGQTDLHDIWHVSVINKHRRFKYAFLLEDTTIFGSNKIVNNEEPYNLFNFFSFPYMADTDLLKAPEWVHNTIWYHIFPDRFHSENPLVDWETSEVKNNIIFGGSLSGITRKLDYLEDLGVNGIYLNPIFKSPSAHKYDTEDYLTVDPSFGTNQDLIELVQEAHNKNMKVMIDAVFNHCGWEHPCFQDVVKNGSSSKYYTWFKPFEEPMINMELIDGQPVRGTRPNYETFAHTPFMPKWNTDNVETQDYLIDIALTWIKEFDIDAIRYDVADEVSHHFITRLTLAIKQLKPDFYQVGETWHNANAWLSTTQFDSVMNYKLMFAVEDYFQNETSGKEFAEAITIVKALYPQNALEVMYNLLDSHDTPRVIHKLKENTKLALIFLILFPGRPAIYYGTEMDLEGEMDPDNRRPFPWNEQLGDTYKLLKRLFEIKKEYNPKEINFVNTENCVIYDTEELRVILAKEDSVINLGQQFDIITNQTVTLNKVTKGSYYIIKRG